MKQLKFPAHSSYQHASYDDGRTAGGDAMPRRLVSSLWHALLHAGLQAPTYLSYLLYLAGLFLLKFDYSAQSFNFLWSQQEWAHYGVLALIVAFSTSALMAAGRCLQLPAPAGRFSRTARLAGNLGLAGIAVCVALGYDSVAANVAVLLLGLWLTDAVFIALRLMLVAGAGGVFHYFFLASLCTIFLVTLCVMLGSELQTLGSATYQLLELGLIAQMSLLALALAQQARQHRVACTQAEYLACRDSLTALYNRRAFLQMAQPIWSNAQRNARPLSMIMIDLDHFKRINDQHGHAAGDRALEVSATLFEQACRGGDLLCRWGGEEFLMLLPETDMEQACAFAERVRAALEHLGLPVESQSIFLTASFGIAEATGKSTLEDLIKAADLRLYDAKTHGRNRISSEQIAFFNSVLRA